MDWTPLGASNDVQAIMNTATALLQSEVFAHGTTYDALNRPTAITTPDRSVAQPSYNERRLLDQLSVYVAPKNSMEQMIASLSYNEKGQRLECDYGNGAVTKYSYDSKTFRLTELVTTRPNGGGTDTLQDLSYYYDPVGNIVEIDDGAQPTIFFSNAVVTANGLYWYDPVYRLTQAIGREHLGQAAAGQTLPPPQYDWQDAFRIGLPQPGDGSVVANYTEQYQYDSVGNIAQISHQLPSPFSALSWTRSYQNDAGSNRLLSTSLPGDSATPPYSATYGYDNNGNMNAMHHLSLIQWDYKNQLQATSLQVVTGAAPPTTYYVYDAAGQRVRKVTESSGGTKVNERIYLGGYEVYREYSAGNAKPTLERQTLHVMDDKRRVVMVESKTIDSSVASTSLPVTVTRYQFDNHLGSACLELDDSAVPAIISYEEYYPYGNTSYQAVNSAIEVSSKRYRYSGKERDDESGFYYYGARYYAPWLGRWASCDPSGIVDDANVYRFVHSNPVNGKDAVGTQTNTTTITFDDPQLIEGRTGRNELIKTGAAAARTADDPETAREFTALWKGQLKESMNEEAKGWYKAMAMIWGPTVGAGVAGGVAGGAVLAVGGSKLAAAAFGGFVAGSVDVGLEQPMRLGFDLPLMSEGEVAGKVALSTAIPVAFEGAVQGGSKLVNLLRNVESPMPIPAPELPVGAASDAPAASTASPSVIIDDPEMAAAAEVTQGAPRAGAATNGPVSAMRPINPGESYIDYGQHAHQVGLGNYLSQTDPNAGDLFLNVATGQNGPDVWPLSNAHNFTVGELKPIGYSQPRLISQQLRWGLDPAEVRQFFYDRLGNFYEGMLQLEWSGMAKGRF